MEVFVCMCESVCWEAGRCSRVELGYKNSILCTVNPAINHAQTHSQRHRKMPKGWSVAAASSLLEQGVSISQTNNHPSFFHHLYFSSVSLSPPSAFVFLLFFPYLLVLHLKWNQHHGGFFFKQPRLRKITLIL